MDIRYAVRVFAFKDNKVACIKYKNINKDYFDIPGGKIEDGETEIQTCIREFKEETEMDIDDLRCIGNVEIIYPGENKKFVIKTYIAKRVNGTPLDFDDNYAYWLPINELTNNEKRFAITHLLDDDLIKYFEAEKISILFTCDHNHNITNMEIKNELLKNILNKNAGILIGGFKAIGKSTLAKKYNNVVDIESSDFEYIIDEELKKIPIEQRKGRKNRVKNPDYPLNYYNELISNLKNDNIILFACKPEIIDLLNENNIDYYIVYPEEDMLQEIVDRCKSRGNNQEFVSRIKKVYYADFPKNDDKVIWLQKGQYLEDLLAENGLLTTKKLS